MKKLILAGLLAALAVGCEKNEQTPTADAPEQAAAEIKAEEAKPEEGAAKAEGDKAEANADGDKAEEAATVATVGKPAPDFTLKDETGKEHKLSDYKGKVVVLEWTCPTCPYVVRHYEEKTMEKTHAELGKDKVVWLAVDSSHFVKPEESAEWKKKEGFGYPVLQDADGKVGTLYNAKRTPHMFIVDAEGVLRYDGAIDNNPRGEVESPTNFVSQAVGALLEGKDVPEPKNTPYGCTVKYNKS